MRGGGPLSEPNVHKVRTDDAPAKLTKLTVPRAFHGDAPAPEVTFVNFAADASTLASDTGKQRTHSQA
jgi:hypothetical protein